MQAHRGALALQIVIAGTARLGSSNVPTRTKTKCGLASASLKSGVPQDGQNRRCMRFPLSATDGKSAVAPVTAKETVRKQAFTVPLPAPRYWHSRHQHTRVTIGASELCQRTAPHRHLPATIMLHSSVGHSEGRLRMLRAYAGHHHYQESHQYAYSRGEPVWRAVRPNPSLKRSANGRPPGPVWRYAVHFRQPGPGVLPSSPA